MPKNLHVKSPEKQEPASTSQLRRTCIPHPPTALIAKSEIAIYHNPTWHHLTPSNIFLRTALDLRPESSQALVSALLFGEFFYKSS
jgi:hypothetical protein